MSYATQYADAANASFQQRVQISLCAAAISITNESTQTANHAARAALAKQVLLNPSGYAALFASGVVSDQATNNSSTDAQLDARISAIWNSYT